MLFSKYLGILQRSFCYYYYYFCHAAWHVGSWFGFILPLRPVLSFQRPKVLDDILAGVEIFWPLGTETIGNRSVGLAWFWCAICRAASVPIPPWLILSVQYLSSRCDSIFILFILFCFLEIALTHHVLPPCYRTDSRIMEEPYFLLSQSLRCCCHAFHFCIFYKPYDAFL